MAIEKVKAYFKNYGMEDRVMEKDSSSATVEEAADVLGCEPGRIAKTLSFHLDEKVILIVTAGDKKIDNKKYVMILTDEEMDEFERNITSYTDLKAVFVNQDILLSATQQKLLDSLSSYVIPDYYFDFELREAGELW